MIRKFIYYLILTAVVFSCVTVQVPAFADEATEDYTDITHSLSNEQRNSLSDYLCRFGACYTTDFEGENGGKIVLDPGNWTKKMSEIIWWQFLAYSKRDRQNPNAPIDGNT